MSETYFNLKRKLEELGYNNPLPLEAVPLVDCVIADLLQTTRSLQHYMDLSKEALVQRDQLMLEAEPYRCDNAKLVQGNNRLYKEIIELKEEYQKLSKESRRKIKYLTEELMNKDSQINKLQHENRDLSLRGLCADTMSSRNKNRRKDAGDNMQHKQCVCTDKTSSRSVIDEFSKKIKLFEEKIEEYCDEIALLQNQVEHRDNEIIRLNMLLEKGRAAPIGSKDSFKNASSSRVQEVLKQMHELEKTNHLLKKEIDSGLEKQHEAMLRALSLADKNKSLQDELQKVDALALRVEEDANKRLAIMMNDLNFLQARMESLTLKNSEMEKELMTHNSVQTSPQMFQLKESLNSLIIEKEQLQKEVNKLTEVNKSYQEKLSVISKKASEETGCEASTSSKYPTKDDIQRLLKDERFKYEKHLNEIQGKLTESISLFNEHLRKCKNKELIPNKESSSPDSAFVRELHNKLCEKEQKILMLKKEIDELKRKSSKNELDSKQNYKDIISQLNVENAELSKENISLSQQLSQCRNSSRFQDRGDGYQREIIKLKDEIESLTHDVMTLRKDKQEYNYKYKEAMELVEKLKRDLASKQNEVELLQEENCSYKMTNRTGKASADHLKDECSFLREQIKRIQGDVIKEKTLANQIKNIQIETERSSNEVQNELLCVQKKLNMSKDNIDSLERKCRELQNEIISLKNDKANLMDNFRKVDQERDKLVIELDKTENMNVLEQRIKTQSYEMSKLENEIAEYKRRLNINKVSEHKLVDFESQISFLNGEILRITQQFDSAVIENKHLQNSLADANGSLKITKIEYEKSKREVDGLKQQLQHYVAEIRRIEELMSQKEAERSDMLEHFASLSVEANILENTNHSLESESASKSMQLQSYIAKIQDLESKLIDKESIIDSQTSKIASMTCKMTALENEIKLISEEKSLLEQNVSYLKQMCNNMQSENTSITRGIGDTEAEIKLYENKIKSLNSSKTTLQIEKDGLKEKLAMTEKLFSNARREIVELKLALQDATSETKSLQEHVTRLSKSQVYEKPLSHEDLQLPLMLEDTLHEESNEDEAGSSQYQEVFRYSSHFQHGSTL